MRKLLQKINIVLFISLILFSTGCSKKNTELIIAESGDILELSDPVELRESAEEANLQNTLDSDASSKDDSDTVNEESRVDIPLQNVIVHVCGAVETEGVYELDQGSRVIDAVNAAGGFSEDADASYVNQAQVLEDGVKLRIPTVEETLAFAEENEGTGTEAETGLEVISGSSSETEKPSVNKDGSVNINTASESELCEIPGIGPSRAKSIIAYREEHGRFGTIEDIMNVSGIKDKFFVKIKDHITV